MTSIRAITRVLLAALVLAAGLALSGCEDPKLMAMFDGKKKLAGDRKEVFPGGVPGVQQGVPPELMKGYQPPPEENPQQSALAPASAEQAPAPQAAPARQASAAPPPAAEEKGGILVGNAASGIAPPKPKKHVTKPKPKPVAAAPQGAQQPYTPPVQQQAQPQPQQPQPQPDAAPYSQPRAWPGGR